MSRHPAALRSITALLESREGEAEPLVFKAGADVLIDRALAAVPTEDRAAGVAEVKALLGLVVVLREERGARAAASIASASALAEACGRLERSCAQRYA